VRGNHFAAEIVALVLLGLLLQDEVPEAKRWLAYGRRHVEREVVLQFTQDGVQFEKSTSYHRLVTELFLLALIALEKNGLTVDTRVTHRLRQACRYVRAYLRPDGIAPIWGDSDDARAMWFDVRPHGDHRPLLTLAAAFFGDDCLATGRTPSITVPLLLGSKYDATLDGVQKRCARETAGEPPNVGQTFTADRRKRPGPFFPQGGMVCVAFGNDHFMADVGSVGLSGRGGHGHLDALSFTLTLGGVPLIVDPGSYLYTGDPQARNRFRSTRAHNVLMVDGQEMATMFSNQLWRLGTEAEPFDVSWRPTEDGFALSARHDGFHRLPDRVKYQRLWMFSFSQQRLEVFDHLDCRGRHLVERFLHFAPGLLLELDGPALQVGDWSGRQFTVTWDACAAASLLDDWVSESYGHKTRSRTLVLSNAIDGPARLDFQVLLSHTAAPTSGQLTLTQSAIPTRVPV
jgi:hypothetical protein